MISHFSGALDDNDNTCSQSVKKIKTEHSDEAKSLEHCSQDQDSSCNTSKVKCEPENHESERKIDPSYVQIVVPKKEVSEIICHIPLCASVIFVSILGSFKPEVKSMSFSSTRYAPVSLEQIFRKLIFHGNIMKLLLCSYMYRWIYRFC